MAISRYAYSSVAKTNQNYFKSCSYILLFMVSITASNHVAQCTSTNYHTFPLNLFVNDNKVKTQCIGLPQSKYHLEAQSRMLQCLRGV